MATKPFQIVIAQVSVYVAPVGEAFPDVDETPAGNWVLLGVGGTESMGDAGCVVTKTQGINLHTVYGVTAPVKASRASEGLTVTFSLADLGADELSRVLNDNTVTATAAGSGTPGYDTVNLYRGLTVSEKAWLFKGNASAAGDGWNTQYELPRGIVTSSPALAFAKADPVSIDFEVTGLWDTDETAGEELGRVIVQTATAL